MCAGKRLLDEYGIGTIVVLDLLRNMSTNFFFVVWRLQLLNTPASIVVVFYDEICTVFA